jgi:hypothetical protein
MRVLRLTIAVVVAFSGSIAVASPARWQLACNRRDIAQIVCAVDAVDKPANRVLIVCTSPQDRDHPVAQLWLEPSGAWFDDPPNEHAPGIRRTVRRPRGGGASCVENTLDNGMVETLCTSPTRGLVGYQFGDSAWQLRCGVMR